MALKGKKLAFMGGGNMATALVLGILNAKLATIDQITVTDPFEGALTKFRERKIRATTNNKEAIQDAHVVVLAVKPQIVPVVLTELRPVLRKDVLIVSIAAGVTLETLEKACPKETHVIRVMPNTPCLVGAGAAGYCLGKYATAEDAKVVDAIFSATGRAYRLEAKLLDAVTGLSGSGPAFVFVIIEALADAGVLCGLPRNVAQGLAAQTVFGSAKMVLETGRHPGELKDAVCSPGGTTIAGIRELEAGKLRATLIKTVVAAAEKSTYLSKASKL